MLDKSQVRMNSDFNKFTVIKNDVTVNFDTFHRHNFISYYSSKNKFCRKEQVKRTMLREW